MAIIYSNGNFHVEAVIVKGRTVFRVCEYRGTESTVLDTFESGGVATCMRHAIVLCAARASLGAEKCYYSLCSE